MQSDQRYIAATKCHKFHIGIMIPSSNPIFKTHHLNDGKLGGSNVKSINISSKTSKGLL
jgi:hypothetical protein